MSDQRQHLAAYTEPTPHAYPAYVSVTREADGRVVVRARGAGAQFSVSVDVSDSFLQELADSINRDRKTVGYLHPVHDEDGEPLTSVFVPRRISHLDRAVINQFK